MSWMEWINTVIFFVSAVYIAGNYLMYLYLLLAYKKRKVLDLENTNFVKSQYLRIPFYLLMINILFLVNRVFNGLFFTDATAPFVTSTLIFGLTMAWFFYMLFSKCVVTGDSVVMSIFPFVLRLNDQISFSVAVGIPTKGKEKSSEADGEKRGDKSAPGSGAPGVSEVHLFTIEKKGTKYVFTVPADKEVEFRLVLRRAGAKEKQ